MPNTQFDPRVEVGNVNLFKGEFLSMGIRQEPALPHHVSNRIIDPTKPFFIDLKWKVTGAEVPLRMNAVSDWRIYAYVESMGPGPEVSLTAAPAVVPRGAINANEMSWSHSIQVAANQLAEHLPNSGVYKLVVVVFANSTLPGPGDDVIGYTELAFLLGSEDPR
ncbi:MAG: hypothetical protein BWK73_08055 [Thiothrix lacustris]|uniref:Uncharacterized protein n=1 Tax=Thiothrix lacustris TaxID=525917 RepID=A0A1Y1QWC2_9GAMM|nr:MAG: hypothetical protein BWK73_08055 [Thiothrix lacustris]